MALTGHLSDLSLSELIEFFCNQRKTGRLKVLYPKGAGYFHLQTGSVVDARIGVLRGIDAVYYALTLPNAKFEFSASNEPSERTINQPWTQVVLEGLRRLDEGILPSDAFPPGYVPSIEEGDAQASMVAHSGGHLLHMPAFLSFVNNQSVTKRKPLLLGAVIVAVLASVAVIGVPAGWYRAATAPAPASGTRVTSSPTSQSFSATANETTKPDNSSERANDVGLAPKRQRERDRARAERSPTANQLASSSSVSDAAKSGPKRVVVTVTYDESGRVTQASGGDATALRIARQKRFPPGKAGSATITIPIN